MLLLYLPQLPHGDSGAPCLEIGVTYAPRALSVRRCVTSRSWSRRRSTSSTSAINELEGLVAALPKHCGLH